jgi:hypothetical protein
MLILARKTLPVLSAVLLVAKQISHCGFAGPDFSCAGVITPNSRVGTLAEYFSDRNTRETICILMIRQLLQRAETSGGLLLRESIQTWYYVM